MAGQFEILSTFTYVTDTHILIAKLEAEGIHCFLDDENLASTQPFLSNAIDGIKIKVRKEDHERADIILKQYQQDRNKLEAEQETKQGKEYKKIYEYCPKCESSEVYRKKGFSFSAREHKCSECGYIWEK